MERIKNSVQTIIDLSVSGDAETFKDTDQIIQQDAMHSFFKHVSKSCEDAIKYRTFLDVGRLEPRSRYHDTIMVCGSRGSGKSTFVLSMFELLKNPPQSLRNSYKSAFDGEVEVLGILDPTLIEEKDHIFIQILSLIKDRVDSRYNYNNDIRCNANCNSDGNDRVRTELSSGKYREESYRSWLNMLRSLAAGLPTMDGVSIDNLLQAEKWHDSLLVLEKGLKNSSASFNLEISFHLFVDMSLKLLEKKAFIIAFDDIDTNFKRGWPLLEIIRKYLTTPQIITVLSGDVDLYSILVRSEQWKNIGNDIVQQENNRIESYRSMVNELEKQYMLKLFKPQRRIELLSIHKIYENAHMRGVLAETEVLIGVRDNNSDGLEDIKTLLKDILKDVYLIGGSDVNIYLGHIMREPVRTILRIARSCYGYLKEVDSRQGIAQIMGDVLIDINYVQLHQYKIDIRSLRDPDPRVAFNQLVVALCDNNLISRGYRLKADYEHMDLNKLVMVLAAIYTSLIKQNPGLVFDYFTKVGLSREIAILINKDYSLASYMDWVGLKEGESGLAIARHFSGYVRSLKYPNTKKNTDHGTVTLSRPEQKKSSQVYSNPIRSIITRMYGESVVHEPLDPRRSLLSKLDPTHYLYEFLSSTVNVASNGKFLPTHKAYFYNTLEEIQDRINTWHWRLVNIPVHRAISNRAGTTVLWSMHGLLALLSELLASDGKKDIKKHIILSSQLRDYPQPDLNIGGSTATENISGEESTSSEEVSAIPLDILNKINAWKDDYKKIQGKALPVHVMAKIFTRYYYSLGRIDSDNPQNNNTLGNLAHRYIVVLLNSVLVEECLYRDIEDKIVLQNPITSDGKFNSNMARFADIGVNGPVFWNWLMKCPLLPYYVNPDSELFKKFISIGTCKRDDVMVTYLGSARMSMFGLLNSILVSEYKYQEDSSPDVGQDSLILQNKRVIERFSIVKYGKLVSSNKVNIVKFLNKNKSNIDRMVAAFIEEFLEGKYQGIPRNPTGPRYKWLRQELVGLLKK